MPTSNFDLLAPVLQQWAHSQGWSYLRDIQRRSLEEFIQSGDDLLLCASTASGKTEAAFLPILSEAVDTDWSTSGIFALYVAPLKTLIDDQFARLRSMCASTPIQVHRSHGDVSTSQRQRLLEEPSGILLITPESLESLLVRKGSAIPHIFQSLRFVVIDEVHSFLGTSRGAQLQSLLNRLDAQLSNRARRLGLSATVGEPSIAQGFLRPKNPNGVKVILASPHSTSLKVRVEAFPESKETPRNTAMYAIAEQLFRRLYGTDNLIFANSRANVELLSHLLQELCTTTGVTNHFFPHHGSLSQGLRHQAEEEIRDVSEPTTIVCTSTLELGVDIGSVFSVAQVGPPPSANSLRQRVGRSGRRNDDAILQVLVIDREPDDHGLCNHLSLPLLQAVAAVRLLMRQEYETPATRTFNLSTFVQQTLSMAGERGGISAQALRDVLCGPGPFASITPEIMSEVLTCLVRHELIHVKDDELSLTAEGLRQVGIFTFYAAFDTLREWNVALNGHIIASCPLSSKPAKNQNLILGGRAYIITTVDWARHRLDVAPSATKKETKFFGASAPVSTALRQEILSLLGETAITDPFLDETSTKALRDAQATWQEYASSNRFMRVDSAGLHFFPWCSDVVLRTIGLLLDFHQASTFSSVEDGCIHFSTQSIAEAVGVLRQVILLPQPAPTELVARIPQLSVQVEKWDWCLTPELKSMATAEAMLDIPGALEILEIVVKHSSI